MSRIRIYLWSLHTPAIIVPKATNVIYCNQVDGVATTHRELEGFLIPLPPSDAKSFRPQWWYRHCNRRRPGNPELWKNVADEIEAALNQNKSDEMPQNLRVVRDADNVEAWFHVTFDLLVDAVNNPAAQRHRGVLTWENCD